MGAAAGARGEWLAARRIGAVRRRLHFLASATATLLRET